MGWSGARPRERARSRRVPLATRMGQERAFLARQDSWRFEDVDTLGETLVLSPRRPSSARPCGRRERVAHDFAGTKTLVEGAIRKLGVDPTKTLVEGAIRKLGVDPTKALAKGGDDQA